MAKNFATLYATGNDSSALEQKFYLKEEVTRGQLIAPVGTDYIYTRAGGSVNFSQPAERSDHKTGRHANSVIKQKTNTEWSFPTYFNIDTSFGVADDAEIDVGMRLLWKNLLGREQIGPLTYDSLTEPSQTFSLFENGDLWAKQANGAYVESGNNSFDGSGASQSEWAGLAQNQLLVGIGKSITANAANTVTLTDADEASRFPVGAMVMGVLNDGLIRSGDTPDGSPRKVVSVSGADVVLDGAVLAAMDGSVNPVYLVYYDPENPTAIDNPQTGLQGSVVITGLATDCVRSAGINIVNNHEPQDFCFGVEGLSSKSFAASGLLEITVSLELNLNHDLIEYMNGLREFLGTNIVLKNGDPAGRHFEATLPKVVFDLPAIEVPDSGTNIVSFEGKALQTGLDLADELVAKFL